jgi:hypothetical protein
MAGGTRRIDVSRFSGIGGDGNMSRIAASSLRRSEASGAVRVGKRGFGQSEDRAFSDQIAALVQREELEDFVERNAAESAALLRSAERLATAAFEDRDPDALFQVHRALYALYEDSLRPAGLGGGHNQFNIHLITLRSTLERRWEKFEVDRLGLIPEEVPTDPEAFRTYFMQRCWGHRMIGHPLFEFLSKDADRGQLINFFLNDGAVIVRFCDLVVLSMVGVDEDVRPELANNFWDEMGQGNFQERHVQLYRDLLSYTGTNTPGEELSTEHFVDRLDWSGLAGYNLYLYLCLHRRNQFRALGALGAAEMTDPPQYGRVLVGCRRVGLDDNARLAYYASHEECDVGHGAAWLSNVLLPLVRKYPAKRHEIVAGALIRMNVTLDYYDNLLEGLRGGSR